MTTIRGVDLFTGVGGAFKGYTDAGIEMVASVDIAHQPDHPDQETFVKGDALEFLRLWIAGRHRVNADFVHASPPCQKACTLTAGTNKHLADRYVDVYDETKELLEQLGLPYVIENPRARPDVVLCGEMFGLEVIRHRNLELGGWSTDFNWKRDHVKHRGRVAGMRHGEWHEGPYYAVYGEGGGKGTVPEWKRAMGIDWTDNRKSIAEAIPPAYTRWVGERLLAR
jgi:hypothetical protein